VIVTTDKRVDYTVGVLVEADANEPVNMAVGTLLDVVAPLPYPFRDGNNTDRIFTRVPEPPRDEDKEDAGFVARQVTGKASFVILQVDPPSDYVPRLLES
jgi:hypothetical protein